MKLLYRILWKRDAFPSKEIYIGAYATSSRKPGLHTGYIAWDIMGGWAEEERRVRKLHS
jgi:hypothetical protein